MVFFGQDIELHCSLSAKKPNVSNWFRPGYGSYTSIHLCRFEEAFLKQLDKVVFFQIVGLQFRLKRHGTHQMRSQFGYFHLVRICRNATYLSITTANNVVNIC